MAAGALVVAAGLALAVGALTPDGGTVDSEPLGDVDLGQAPNDAGDAEASDEGGASGGAGSSGDDGGTGDGAPGNEVAPDGSRDLSQHAALGGRPDVPRWRAALPAPAVDVAVGDDLVVAATGGAVQAFDRHDGEPRWTRPLEEGVISGLELVGDRLLVTRRDEPLVALNASTGEVRWTRPDSANSVVVAGDVVVIGDGEVVEARSVADGSRRWHRRLPAALADGSADGVVAATIDDALIGLDVRTGATRWSRSLEPQTAAHQSAEQVVVGTGAGLGVLDVETGRVLAEPTADDLGGQPRGQARMIDGVVTAAVGSEVVTVDADAAARWRHDTGEQAWLLGETGIVAVVESGARLVLLEPGTGAEALRLTFSGWFTALALEGDDLVVAVQTPDRGQLDVYELPDGERSDP